MTPRTRPLLLGVALLTLSHCTATDPYGPAIPMPRWENTPFIPQTAPPPELAYQPPPPAPSLLPSPEEWQQWQPMAKPVTRCAGKGKARRCRSGTPSIIAQTNTSALVKPTLRHVAGLNSAMVRYPYDRGHGVHKIYEVHCAVSSPCYILFPPGEHLTTPPALNTDEQDPASWSVGYAKMGTGEDKQEALVLRPRSAPQTVFNGLLFKSGLIIFVKLIAVQDGGMLSVTWDLPTAQTPPIIPVAQRPPKVNETRLFSHYSIKVLGKAPPPWMPVAVLDDGSKTFIKFAEPLTFTTNAPAVYGVTQQGTATLVQSHMFVREDRPADGAWLIIQGIRPAHDLKDGLGMGIRIERGDVHAPALTKGGTHAY